MAIHGSRGRPSRWSTWLVPFLLAACEPLGLGDDGRDRLEENRRRWERNGYASYDLTVRAHCFCGIVEPVRIEVRDGVRVATILVSSGEPVPVQADWFPTVPGLFDIVEDAIERDAHALDVRYHDDLGVPMRIEIDYIGNAIDDEVTWTVEALVPR